MKIENEKRSQNEVDFHVPILIWVYGSKPRKINLTKETNIDKWNKILFRPDQFRYWWRAICLWKMEHEPLQNQVWKTATCTGVCEEFVLRRGKKVEENSR